ncbi:sugar dehydrogenase complex small subunit [Burkholderia sp. Ac-20353]|uniref:sugar dehydrogenase complex small subunit n=1 Tax=Burkholderia sp. Ac-20353 TaxID=2703894 RepID=UPI00197C5682|nr:sugar dehydrogenase complex small subunit [Burkholderia sp. Ac-20353]
MSEIDSFPGGGDLPNLRRRLLLASVVAACSSTLIPWAKAQPSSAKMAAPDSFMQVSKILTGQGSPDVGQAARLYQALISDEAAFREQHQQLLAYINEHKADPMQLQPMLDAEKSPLAALPRRIVTAWYTGIVGDGERARCITFETNLLNVLTSDRLKPPSYSYGVYGSWAAQPA